MSVDIPKEGWACIVHDEGPNFSVEVTKLPVPEPRDDELLVRLNCTGLCMSDVHYMLNDWDMPKMSEYGVKCPGHEGAGVVVKVGAKCPSSWKVGDRVGIKPLYDVCHNCDSCWNGRENYCSNGIYTGLHSQGTYCQYLTSPAIYTSRIPDGVSDEIAGPIMCSASTMHRGLIESGLKPGDWVVFPGGGGGVGSQGIQLAKAMGMRPIAIDGGEAKEKLCLSIGAEAFVDFTKTKDVAGEIKRIADGVGAHGVVVTAYQAYKDAISYVGDRKGARIMCVALPPAGTVQLGSEPSTWVFKNLYIIGTLIGTMQDTASCLDYARRGLLKPICEVRGRSRWAESVEQLAKGQVAGRIVIDFNKE